MSTTSITSNRSWLRRIRGAFVRNSVAHLKQDAMAYEQRMQRHLAENLVEVFRRIPALSALTFIISCRAMESTGPLRPLSMSCSTMVWLNKSCTPTSLVLPNEDGQMIDIAAGYLRRFGDIEKATDIGFYRLLSQHLNEEWPGFDNLAEFFPGVGHIRITRNDITDPVNRSCMIEPEQVLDLLHGTLQSARKPTGVLISAGYSYEGDL